MEENVTDDDLPRSVEAVIDPVVRTKIKLMQLLVTLTRELTKTPRFFLMLMLNRLSIR